MQYRTSWGDTVSEWELESQFEEMINESYPLVEIIGMYFEPGRALKELDPIAFRESFLNYIDGMVQDGELEEI